MTRTLVYALIGHRPARESAFFACRCETRVRARKCLFIHTDSHSRAKFRLDSARESRRSFCRVYTQYVPRERARALEISSFHRECRRRGPQKAVESYGWYALRARNTRRTRGPTSCWPGVRYRPPFAAHQRERERKREREGETNLCAVRPCVCSPCLRVTRRERARLATLDRISPMWAGVKRPAKGWIGRATDNVALLALKLELESSSLEERNSCAIPSIIKTMGFRDRTLRVLVPCRSFVMTVRCRSADGTARLRNTFL